MDRNYDVIIFILRRPKVASFANIIKIVTMFIKTSSRLLKELKIMYQNAVYIYIS